MYTTETPSLDSLKLWTFWCLRQNLIQEHYLSGISEWWCWLDFDEPSLAARKISNWANISAQKLRKELGRNLRNTQ